MGPVGVPSSSSGAETDLTGASLLALQRRLAELTQMQLFVVEVGDCGAGRSHRNAGRVPTRNIDTRGDPTVVLKNRSANVVAFLPGQVSAGGVEHREDRHTRRECRLLRQPRELALSEGVQGERAQIPVPNEAWR